MDYFSEQHGQLNESASHTLLAISSIASSSFAYAQQNPVPHLRKQGTATQLIVDGKPFLVLAGELGNSTFVQCWTYMRPIWPKLVALNLNTVLVPVYWELIEPTEGKFDFTLVDGLIQEARKHKLRLVPLWFASWKNSMSCYAPAWVKTDQRRFPRSQDRNGNGIEILSPLAKKTSMQMRARSRRSCVTCVKWMPAITQ